MKGNLKHSSFNIINKKGEAASIESLFYKKQGHGQAILKESRFHKSECLAEEILKRMKNFDLKLLLERFISDSHFKSHVNQQMVKVQTLISKTQIDPIDEEFEFDSIIYEVNNIESLMKSFKYYRETL